MIVTGAFIALVSIAAKGYNEKKANEAAQGYDTYFANKGAQGSDCGSDEYYTDTGCATC